MKLATVRIPALAESLGLLWAIGIAVYSASLFMLAFVGAPFGTDLVIPLLGVTLLTGIVAGLILYRTRIHTLVAHDADHMLAPIVTVLAVCASVASASWQALRAPLEYGTDAWAIWAFKAHVFQHGSLFSGYFHDPLTFFTQSDFPLNLSVIEAVVFRLGGSHGTDGVALLGPACLAALLLLFYGGLSRLFGQIVAALMTVSLACLPHMSSQAAIGYADVPLAMYAGGASLYLLLWQHQRRRSDLFIMGLLAGGAVWTKKEGLVIAGALLAVSVLAEVLPRPAERRERWRNLGTALVGTGTLSLPWLACLLINRPQNKGGDLLPLTLTNFATEAYRIPVIAEYFVRQMLTFQNWEFLWVVLVVVVLFRNRRLPSSSWALLLVLLIQLAAYFQASIFSTWGSLYTLHMQSFLDRVFLQAAPLALLIVADALCTIRGDAAPSTVVARRRESDPRTAMTAPTPQKSRVPS